MAIYVYNNTSSVYAQNRRASSFTADAVARLSIVERTAFERNPNRQSAGREGAAYSSGRLAERSDLERAARNLSISRVNLASSESKIRDLESASALAAAAGRSIVTDGAKTLHNSDIAQRALRVLL